jgi:rhodanese-related sulfurtransferase
MMKWLAIAGLILGMFASVPVVSAQDDGEPFDPAAMAAPPVQFIKPAAVLKLIQEKATTFQLVDTQPPEAFEEGHIPGAVNFPWVPQIKPPISLPRNKMLILYCPCTHDEDSIDMTKKLAEFGYYNIKVLEGGWYKWVALKYPIEGTDTDAAAQSASAASGAAPASAQPAAAAPSATTTAIKSGRQVGAVTPSFRVIDVTGKYKGQETCYVCEYGTAPTVIGFFDSPSDQAADLIVKLNALAEKGSSKNLKAFAVMVNGPESKPWLEKLAQDKGIQIPLVYLKRGPKDLGVRLYHINTQAKNTFLVNDKRQVIANMVNVNDSSFRQVADAATKMLGGD